LTLADLPRARAGATVALPGLDQWTKSDPRTIALPRVGTLRLAFDGIRTDAPAEISEAGTARFMFFHRGAQGAISVERVLAARIVGAMLKTEVPLLERALGRAERGVLAAAISETLRRLGSPWRLSMGMTSLAKTGDHAMGTLGTMRAVTLTVTIDGLGAPARVLLEVPLALLSSPAAGVDPARATALQTTAVVELGVTKLSYGEWAAIRAGDALVFDGQRAPTPAEPWNVRLCVGRSAAPAVVEAGGAMRLLDGFRPLAVASGRILRNNGERMDDEVKDERDPPLDPTMVLAAAPIEIVAEVGRLSVRGDELLSLARGGVLTFGGLQPSSIALRVGDEIWARGELVDVDGELGVRITELTPAHPAHGRE
jgi:type III secretion system YscQ/HrcQ family protein